MQQRQATVRHVLTALVALFVLYSLWFRGSLSLYSDIFHRDKKTAVVGDLTDLVNVFIGTTKGGHVFPGATVPHGMIKAGLDTDSPDNHAGYDANPRYKAIGFSQLHDDGTGGWAPLSNFKLWPIPFCTQFSQCTTAVRSRGVYRNLKPGTNFVEGQGDLSEMIADDSASPGYFSTRLSNRMHVELTATRRAALHRYSFPPRPPGDATDWRPRIVIDITNDGMRAGSNGHAVIEPQIGRVTGYARFPASFGVGNYFAYVCVDFRSSSNLSEPLLPVEYGTYKNNYIVPYEDMFSDHSYSERGVLLTFEPNEDGSGSILARVGVSFISMYQACSSAEDEIPDFNFDGVREAARLQWEELLGRFEVSADESQRDVAVLLYSSIYRTHIVPADFTDENPKWVSAEPYYDSLYCNWDTYRTLYPLMSLHDPETFARIVRSFIDIQRHEGWIPECRDAGLQQWIQGGSDGDPILAEFFVKFQNYTNDLKVDPEALYQALLADAENESPDWDLAGRPAELWKTFNYIPFDVKQTGGMNTRHVSRSLEYAYDDFTISQVAKVLNKTEDWIKYANRSRGFELLWNSDTTVLDDEGNEVEGIKGFMQLRNSNGTFVYTDPRHCTPHDPGRSNCYLDGMNKDGFYEGSSIVYSQYAPHDTAKLIQLQGGEDAFIRRLDYIFENDYFDSTNEPSQQIPFMYHYANRPGLSTERSRETIARWYNTSIDGLPGNDDSGAMGSFVAFHLLGLYPLPATRQFLVSSPFFSSIRIRNPYLNTVTTINAHNFKGNPPSGRGGNIYVKSIRINGELWHSKCYIEWDVFLMGATIDLELTDDRWVTCGDDPNALPPSLSTGGYDPNP